MNKREHSRKLTWKYFWQQKWEEVRIVLGLILLALVLVFVPYFLGKFLLYLFPTLDSCSKGICDVLDVWAVGIFVIAILFICIVGPIIWFKANWKKAKARADKEVGLRR